MLPEGSIQVHRLWKRFRADRPPAVLAAQLRGIKTRLRGEHTPSWRWALQDVSLEVTPGESIGLVGPNGSGKSTLLKILTRVMYPYAGRIAVAGRVGALIEVRAGIHPQLTGRENVYLYGSLLGLRRKDVARRFDEIVAFAEIEDAVDRQAKFYSSGMQMRLGFAVAAFLEPDVLLVDEVLAVGDAAFQQKCLDRMRDVLQEGTTLVFVSHDLAAVESTCNRAVWLAEGTVRADGPVRDSLAAYRASVEQGAELDRIAGGLVTVDEVRISSPDGNVRTHGTLEVELALTSATDAYAGLFLGVSEGAATPIFCVHRDVHLTGDVTVTCTVPDLPLPRGTFYVWVGLFTSRRKASTLVPWHPAARFDVQGPSLEPAPQGVVRLSPVHVRAEWSTSTPAGVPR
ncbi:MAG: polysaccharide ABC transporter ATP-binding protein [Actinomycetota bacterium]